MRHALDSTSHRVPLFFSTPGGLTGNDLSRLFITCTNASQAVTCNCQSLITLGSDHPPVLETHMVLNISSESYAPQASSEPSHKGMIFPLNHNILTSHTRRRKLMFKTQIMKKGFKMRVFKFTSIVTTNSSNIISIPLILQPQD
jgi:hypothetical protein